MAILAMPERAAQGVASRTCCPTRSRLTPGLKEMDMILLAMVCSFIQTRIHENVLIVARD
jgi:hypothetical protein